MYESRPWLKFYGDVPETLSYPEISLYDAVMETVQRQPDAPAYDFLGTTRSYWELGAEINRFADALAAVGVRRGDRVTISMPTSPQGVIAFYSAIKLGAVPSLIHPLSTPKEIAHYLRLSRSRFALTLDAFYGSFAELFDDTPLETLVLARIPDYLSLLKRIGFWLTKGRKIPAVPDDPRVKWWSQLMSERHPPAQAAADVDTNDIAAILYSGGTTGTPKGIMLSHRNFIAEGIEVTTWVGVTPADRVLAILPIFHGFGLASLINAPLMAGASVILVPIFTPADVAKLIRTKRPTLMAGVPTLYEALSRDPSLQKADLSCLRAAFSGADTLARPVKERFEQLIEERGGHVTLLEGYGLTEAVTAIIATPLHEYREGSIGIPFPDMLAKICEPDADVERPVGEEGELCVSGPAVMLGYLDNPIATAETLRTHSDGLTWLHTGDLATMDEDGFVRFSCRLKRMIKSSGFNVYPSEVEAVLYRHPAVKDVCVVGVPDATQGERVKAFVTLNSGFEPGPELEAELIAHCREDLIKWSCPRDVEFRDELPLTRLGKIDFVALARAETEQAERGAVAPTPA